MTNDEYPQTRPWNHVTAACHLGNHSLCGNPVGECLCDCHQKKEGTMKLVYQEKPGFACPGSGWPADDHEEADAEVAQAKVNSGFYTCDELERETPESPSEEPEASDESQSPEADGNGESTWGP